MTVETVAVIGLGKLGLCQAAVLANSDITVYGVDIDKQRTEDVNQSQAPFPEPKLQSYLEQSEDNLIATTNYGEAIPKADASIIFVDTPLAEGRHSTKYIQSVCQSLGEELATIDNHHTVILRSTVMPGTTRGSVKTWLEESSSKTVGEELSLAYFPEFTAVGNIIPGMEKPDFFLVGEVTGRGGQDTTAICHTMRKNTAPVLRMTAESAELAKMANNTFRTMKISFANSLAQIADDVNANVDHVVEHFKEDPNIKARYMTPGVRYGGPCYSRDNETFETMAAGTPAGKLLPAATDKVNNKHSEWIEDVVRTQAQEGNDTVTLLGLSYKPGTEIVTSSQGIDLARKLTPDFEVLCHDPQAIPNAREKIGNDVEYEEHLNVALERADVVILATLWNEYTNPSAYSNREIKIIDPWRAFEHSELGKDVDYYPLGKRKMSR